LIDAFYKDLEFGTGGLRGTMGVGSNRMNVYTVGMATQGLANYLIQSFPNQRVSVAVTHDSRLNNTLFADTTAAVLTANGIVVKYFREMRPTPMLSFAIRHYKCQSGIMVTASHNPKEYNGYKVNWEDGAQVVARHELNMIAEVQKIASIAEVKWNKSEGLIEYIDSEVHDICLKEVRKLSMSPEAIIQNKNMTIV